MSTALTTSAFSPISASTAFLTEGILKMLTPFTFIVVPAGSAPAGALTETTTPDALPSKFCAGNATSSTGSSSRPSSGSPSSPSTVCSPSARPSSAAACSSSASPSSASSPGKSESGSASSASSSPSPVLSASVFSLSFTVTITSLAKSRPSNLPLFAVIWPSSFLILLSLSLL